MHLLRITLLFSFLIYTTSHSSEKNNVCESIKDYYTIQDNKNCWYDYITDLELPDIVRKSGRPFEIYKTVTSDGHILSLFRIPNSGLVNKKRSPVFLQHGLISKSKYWVSLGNDSFAFQLSNNGYDVWFGNYRGTEYSTEHVYLTTNDEEYWDYTNDELSLIDLPAMLNKVMEVTGAKNKIIYIGHSLGGTMGLMYTSEFSTKAKTHIKAMILLGPTYKLAHTISPPVTLVAQLMEPIMKIIKRQRVLHIVSQSANGIIRFLCLNAPSSMVGCMQLLGYNYGPKHGIKPSQYPNFLKQQFSRTSIQALSQLTSWHLKATLSKFDYGMNNTNAYRQKNAPIYDVSKVDIPTIIVYARNDWLSASADILQLAKEMNKTYVYKVIEVDEENFGHMDYVFGSRSKEVIVDVILMHMDNLDMF